MGVWKAIRNGWEDFKVRMCFKVGMPLREASQNLFSIASSKDAWMVDVWDGGS